MEKKGWLVFLCLVLFLVFSGCSDLSFRTLRASEPADEQGISSSYRFEDIPIPGGLVLDRRSSFVYETRTTRTGLLVYEGKGEIGRVTLFFKEQMPKYQWRLLSNFQIHNVMLAFVKEGWISVIYIIPKDSDENRVEIRFGPIEANVFSGPK